MTGGVTIEPVPTEPSTTFPTCRLATQPTLSMPLALLPMTLQPQDPSLTGHNTGEQPHTDDADECPKRGRPEHGSE